MKNKKLNILCFSLGFILSLSTIVAFASKSPTTFSINSKGLTYGSALNATSREEEPDLIAAIGVDGTEGYVYASDLEEKMPSSPAEAVAITKAIKEKKAKSKNNKPVVIRSIPLYSSDGKTIIGTFDITSTPNTNKP